MDKRLDELKNWISLVTQLEIDQMKPTSADASFRRYFRVWQGDKVKVAMDAPPEKEDCSAFYDITQRLLTTGVNVPTVFHYDLQKGFMLLSDLGAQNYLDELNKDNVDDLYKDALESLFSIQTQASVSGLPLYDAEMLQREIDLFTKWLLQQYLQINLNNETLSDLNKVFTLLIDSALQQPQVFVHRDYHSRNLMFIPEEVKYQNPGIIDFQDAVKGPITYDIVSLLKDCYVDWPREDVMQWLESYYQINIFNRYKNYTSFAQFLRDFDLMGVQRHLKASGIFCRLYLRDGKSGYLKDIPRTLQYITALEKDYPELQVLIDIINDEILAKWQAH